jgi:hypothetical protein
VGLKQTPLFQGVFHVSGTNHGRGGNGKRPGGFVRPLIRNEPMGGSACFLHPGGEQGVNIPACSAALRRRAVFGYSVSLI